jgi:NitT/TauT family transport system permease protein
MAIADPLAAAKAVHAMAPEVDVEVARAQFAASIPLMINSISKKDDEGAFAKGLLATTWKWTAEAQSLPLDKFDPEKAVALMGHVVAIAVSIPLAVALASSRFLSQTLYPMIVIVQSTPIVAIAPIIVVTLGASDLPRVFITFLITFFPIVVSTVTGLMATPEELIELSRSLQAGRVREMLQIRSPFAVPFILSALNISTTLEVIGAAVAEFVAAERGFGFFIMFSTSFFKIPQAFAGLAVLVALSLVLFRLCSLAQRWFVPWSLPKSQR